MNTRRIQRMLTLIMAIVACLTILSACGSQASQSAATAPPSAPQTTAPEASALPAQATVAPAAPSQPASGTAEGWQDEFNLAGRNLSDSGESRYFVLQPGFQLVLGDGRNELTISVLDETREINGISTRVVEEREVKDGQLYEISRNFFALDPASGDVFYFGEEVDFYANGQVVNHAGSWLAYENGNQPGLIMAGAPTVGMKYYQEIAPDVALDRAEVVAIGAVVQTPAGELTDALITSETTPLEPNIVESKTYVPGIGLVTDQSLKLIRYGYTNL